MPSVSKTLHCPYLDRPLHVTMDYTAVPATDYAKRIMFSECDCGHLDDCPLLDSHKRCPIFLSFPATIKY